MERSGGEHSLEDAYRCLESATDIAKHAASQGDGIHVIELGGSDADVASDIVLQRILAEMPGA